MKILTKKLGKGEIKWGGVVIPRDKTSLFPAPGVEFDLVDEKTRHTAKMDNQSRLRMSSWFRQHGAVKAGDEITLSKQNGPIHISLSRSFLKPENETFDWAHEVLEAVRNGEIHGVIRVSGTGFSVEIGEHIKDTEIILKAK